MRKVKLTLLVKNKEAKNFFDEMNRLIIDEDSAIFTVVAPGTGKIKLPGKIKDAKVEFRNNEPIQINRMKDDEEFYSYLNS